MHLRKWHSDRKVAALTSCDVFGTQTLRLPYDDPEKCEQTELAPKETCGTKNVIEIYAYYSPCDDPVECRPVARGGGGGVKGVTPKWPNPTRLQDNPRVIIKGPKIWRNDIRPGLLKVKNEPLSLGPS